MQAQFWLEWDTTALHWQGFGARGVGSWFWPTSVKTLSTSVGIWTPDFGRFPVILIRFARKETKSGNILSVGAFGIVNALDLSGSRGAKSLFEPSGGHDAF
jgi:hypothetical protein